MFKVKPFIAASSAAARIGGIIWFSEWRKKYVEARDAPLAGEFAVEFPVGTWAMARIAGVKEAAVPPWPAPEQALSGAALVGPPKVVVDHRNLGDDRCVRANAAVVWSLLAWISRDRRVVLGPSC